jgi:hypothetical protein
MTMISIWPKVSRFDRIRIGNTDLCEMFGQISQYKSVPLSDSAKLENVPTCSADSPAQVSVQVSHACDLEY